MDSHGQLITLQFGTVSNWTGAHFWNLQDELHGLADRGADPASSRFDGRVLYDESSSPSASSSAPSFTPRLLSFDEPDALGPGLLLPGSSSVAAFSARNALDDDVALAASAATWGGRAVGVPGGGGIGGAAGGSPSAFAAALAAAEREERRRRRQGASSSFNDDDDDRKLASAARALSLSGGVSSWADFLKAPLAREGGTTVHSFKALGWQPPRPQPPRRSAAAAAAAAAASSSSSSAAALPFVPGARRPGWGPPADEEGASSSLRLLDAVEEGARRLAERCDRLGGFLTFADDARGWGSAASGAAALLRDEYPRSPRLLFALRPPDSLFLLGGGGGSSGSGGGGRGSGAGAAAGPVSASAAAAALSTGALAPLVDLFVPLAPPSALWSSSSLSHSPCDALFRWSAAAAAAIDAATTPLRLLRAQEGGSGGGGDRGGERFAPSSSSSSLAVGGFGAASLAALLAGPRGGPLAALSAALPLPGVPGARGAAAEEQQQRQQQQQRGRGGEGANGGGGRSRVVGSSSSSLWASPPAVSCWTPCSSLPGSPRLLFAEGSLLAESVTVRGALSSLQSQSSSSRQSSCDQGRRRLPAAEALSALEAALSGEGTRAVRQLCASSAPLHLPLPFPEGMLPPWCYETGGGGGRGNGGDDEGGGVGGGTAGGAPALVRLSASRALSSLAADSADLLTLGEEARSSRSRSSRSSSYHASGLRSSRVGGAGGSSLAGSLLPLFDSWGVGAADDAAAAAEAARALADEYRGGGSDGVLSSDNDAADDDGDED